MKRDTSIDIVKGIGIFLVVFAHLNFQEPMQTVIYSFHIPLFFIVSGLLFRREKYETWKSFLVRRFHTLILPYLFFALTTLAFYIAVEFAKNGFHEASIRVAVQYLIQVFIAQYSMVYGPNIPLWFVPCLFLTECLYYWVSSVKSTAARSILIILP